MKTVFEVQIETYTKSSSGGLTDGETGSTTEAATNGTRWFTTVLGGSSPPLASPPASLLLLLALTLPYPLGHSPFPLLFLFFLYFLSFSFFSFLFFFFCFLSSFSLGKDEMKLLISLPPSWMPVIEHKCLNLCNFQSH